MPPAVEELPSGQPTSNGRGPQPYRRPARRVRKIDFTQLDGLSMRADQELRETEDALITRAKSLHPDKDFGETYPSRFRKSG